MSGYPQNFDRLAVGEDQIRQLSKAAIEASEDLSLHARMIEGALSMLAHMARRRPHSDEGDLVLQMLAARLFNSGASAMKLLMCGFYQSAVMVMRDILTRLRLRPTRRVYCLSHSGRLGSLSNAYR